MCGGGRGNGSHAQRAEMASRSKSLLPSGACIIKLQAMLVLISLCSVVVIAGAQSAMPDQGRAEETRVRGYWVDPSTGLMWAAKDNGKDVSWKKAMKYCRDLRLDAYSDWRLPTLSELELIYDRNANAPGLAGPGGREPFTYHVKGNLFLSGNQWSRDQRSDDRGRPSGYVWYVDFNRGLADNLPTGFLEPFKQRALCVRGSRK
jgi:hypothetical protein